MPAEPSPALADRWDDAVAARLDPVDRLVYRSNLLGGETRITNTGGGNTSAKVVMPDPLGGAPCEVLWVKGSGGDLRTATAGRLRRWSSGGCTACASCTRRCPTAG